MTVQKSGWVWGILLIGAGALALAEQMGLLKQMPDQAWVAVFALVALVGFVSYVLSRGKQWGWLFPAGIFGGLAVTTELALAQIDKPAIAAPLFIGLLLPFAAAYLLDRSRHWWALIPGGFMLFLTLVTLFADSHGEWIGSLFLFLIALSFLIVYVTGQTRKWALLVAYIFAVLGIAPIMSTGAEGGAYYGAVFLLAIALPFLYVYFTAPDKWWGLIPASVMIALSLVTVASIAGWIHDTTTGGYASALLLGSLAIAFAIIWLRHAKPWARIVTIIFAGLAVASVVFAAQSEILWPVAIILVGAYVLFTSLRKKAA
jgi:hypothetical protein